MVEVSHDDRCNGTFFMRRSRVAFKLEISYFVTPFCDADHILTGCVYKNKHFFSGSVFYIFLLAFDILKIHSVVHAHRSFKV